MEMEECAAGKKKSGCAFFFLQTWISKSPASLLASSKHPLLQPLLRSMLIPHKSS